MSKISERLILLKKQQNLLQKDVSAATGISIRAYQRYEYGEREPTASALIALADFYQVSIDYLVGRTDDPKGRLLYE